MIRLSAAVVVLFGLTLFAGCGDAPADAAAEAAKPEEACESCAPKRSLALDTAGKRIVERRVIDPARPAADFTLIDQDGTPVTLSELKGSVVAIGFIYTHCPDVCGLLAQTFVQMQTRFAAELKSGDFRPILITTDPKRDTPEVNAKYTRAYRGEWKLLTGTEDVCQSVWTDYGVTRTENKEAQYVYHTYKIVLIDRRGQVRFDFVGLDDPEKELVIDLAALLKEAKQ